MIIGTGGTSEPFHKIAHPLQFRSQVQLQTVCFRLPRAKSKGAQSVRISQGLYACRV